MARASVVVDAPAAAVWDVLLDPDTPTQIMPVTEVVSGWRAGSPFAWVFEMGGATRVDGFVHRAEAPRLLEYDYVDPHSRDVLGRDDTHRVVIELVESHGRTVVTVTQDANLGPAAQAHAEGGWEWALHNLKFLVED